VAPAIAEQVGVQRMGPKIYRKAKLTLKSHLMPFKVHKYAVGCAQKRNHSRAPNITHRADSRICPGGDFLRCPGLNRR
jgi:lipopolysaccharide/colanic/teichoic acid biosynthesis glycosyltransferase